MGYNKNPWVNLICCLCGTEFEVIASREHTAKFCSRKCKDSSIKGLTGSSASAWAGGISHDGRGYPQYSSGPHKGRRVHAVRAEKALGKPLPTRAVVHHPDEDKWNPDARLVICQDQAYHLLLHKLKREKERLG